MIFVESDNREIVSCLEAMKELVVARGGYVHSSARIEERDGSLRVICRDPLAGGQPLFSVPHGLLVPIDNLTWTDFDNTFRLASPPAGLSADQLQMLDLFIAIYNATGKLRGVDQIASMILAKDSPFAAQINVIKPIGIIVAKSSPALFISSRSFASNMIMDGNSFIMPLVDYSNHHADGARSKNEGGRLKFNVCRSIGTDECFHNYGGMKDPLDLALYYNYLDPLSPYAASVPVNIEFLGFGRLIIAARFRGSNHEVKPPKVDFVEDGLIISHFVGDARAPLRVLSTLKLAMLASGKRRGIAGSAVDRALADLPEAILAVNREKHRAFRAYLATRPELPLAALLSGASTLQLANLEKILTA